MEFRQATEADINAIMIIIRQAQAYFKALGIDQWQNNYPNSETIRNDINHKNSYVLLKDGSLVATVAVSFDGEKTYQCIYEGKWIENHPYAVIHRIAVRNDCKGLGLSSYIVQNVGRLCLNRGVNSIRADTHERNFPMQKLLEKNQFKYCGIIYLEDGSKRIAFEKILARKCGIL